MLRTLENVEDMRLATLEALTPLAQDPTVRQQLAAQTQQAAAPMTLAEAARFYEAETARYRAIARQINLQPQ